MFALNSMKIVFKLCLLEKTPNKSIMTLFNKYSIYLLIFISWNKYQLQYLSRGNRKNFLSIIEYKRCPYFSSPSISEQIKINDELPGMFYYHKSWFLDTVLENKTSTLKYKVSLVNQLFLPQKTVANGLSKYNRKRSKNV